MKYNSIVILGGGESGVGAACLAKKKGLKVFVSDNGEIKPKYKKILQKYNILYEEYNHNLDMIVQYNEVIKSPGISNECYIIKELIKRNINIISEIEFACRYNTAKIIAITGSNGKTTTSTLIYNILKEYGIYVKLVGNIGNSFCKSIFKDEICDIYILELSSFQLDNIGTFFKPYISIILNITEDHLDRYDSFNSYIKSKLNILLNQDKNDYCIYNGDDVILENIFKEYKKNKILNNYFSLRYDDKIIFDCFYRKEIRLKGKHNFYNYYAAYVCCQILNINNNHIIESICNFTPLNHRLQSIGFINGVEFINDSKATNVISTYYALQCMTKPVIWILGGVDKGNNYSILLDIVIKKVKYIIALGKNNIKIIDFFNQYIPVFSTSDLKTGLLRCLDVSSYGDVILLSPSCASFDLFSNYEDRGDNFKKEFLHLKNKYFINKLLYE